MALADTGGAIPMILLQKHLGDGVRCHAQEPLSACQLPGPETGSAGSGQRIV